MTTIPIEEFAGYVKKSFVTFFTDLIYTNLVLAAPWAASPILGRVIRWIIEQGVAFMATKGGLVAFMINTKIFTMDQAKDYSQAIDKLYKASDNISDEEWDKLEREANNKFSDLVRFSS